MNILMIARADHTGAGYELLRAIHNHTPHQCRHVVYKRPWPDFPVETLCPTDAELQRLIRWADVINLHADYALIDGKPTVVTYHGSYYRNRWRQLNERDRRCGFVQTALTIDLAMRGPRWIGRAQEDWADRLQMAEGFTVVHSPTHPARKGTRIVKQACAELGIALDVIHRVPNGECIERKSKGHVLVDQVGPAGWGYGTSALEAWALGMPVISCAPDDVLREIARRTGSLPFIVAHDVAELKHTLAALRDDPAACWDWAVTGRAFLRQWHDPEVVAGEFVRACEEAMK